MCDDKTCLACHGTPAEKDKAEEIYKQEAEALASKVGKLIDPARQRMLERLREEIGKDNPAMADVLPINALIRICCVLLEALPNSITPAAFFASVNDLARAASADFGVKMMVAGEDFDPDIDDDLRIRVPGTLH